MSNKITKKQGKRLIDAAENLKKIQEKLAPYSGSSEVIILPRKGKWEKNITSTNIKKDDAVVVKQ
ncbi:hypothetical protein KQH62_00920 [bacterium]|nr:hypothetical protein [bacterium]